MNFQDIPEQSGLYDPSNEHDACGIGAVVNIRGIQSHSVINSSLDILLNLEHRGGTGAEDNTGDGAGILTQIPHRFFKSQNLGFEIGEAFDYAVAFIFLSQNEDLKQKGLDLFSKMVLANGFKLLGFRNVPICKFGIGNNALANMPFMLQAFIERPVAINRGIDFERALYVLRRKIEKEAIKESISKFYFCSFSSRTIVYKGMLKSTQVKDFYLDLKSELYESAIALVHSRFSTNTFPSWERAHPNRFMIHNGEINTINGNVDLIKAREYNFSSQIFGLSLSDIFPVIQKPSSDSAMFDNTLEFLYMAGRSLPEAIMLMIPEPWHNDLNMSSTKRDFYQYNATMMEPWDGPASIVSTDGEIVLASLDRNGLRPSRYYLTDDDMLILSSETGALMTPEEHVIAKKRLEPGKILLVDTKCGRVISDDEVKENISKMNPYSKWLKEMTCLDDVNLVDYKEFFYSKEELLVLEKAYGYKYDTVEYGIIPLAQNGEELLVAMGTDVPLAVLSKNHEPLYKYFKQIFAQVTNPPIDSIREEIVTSSQIYLGKEGNLLEPNDKNCHLVLVERPIISKYELAKILSLDNFKVNTIDITFDYNKENLEEALERVFLMVDEAIEKGAEIIVLSDRKRNFDRAGIPALLATSGVNQHLVNTHQRTQVSIVVETGEAREIHHYACLLGFGATVVCPYLVYDEINALINRGLIGVSYEKAVDNYIHGAMKGIIKIISKMGISTVQAYTCARIFEVIGLSDKVTNKYFAGSNSSIGGIEIEDIYNDVVYLHKHAYEDYDEALDSQGIHNMKNGKEDHLYNPITIYKLQYACRNNDYSLYKEFANEINQMTNNIRNLMDFVGGNEISISEVEPASEIVKRFKTGAMSYGSISKEAHECLAIAMNRIGGKSNTGEGGENEGRKEIKENGDNLLSAIKQVASGRFGVTIDYLVNAKEIQIKIAQGAKPGEGGQLPATKVYPWIAKARHSTPGVSLISPPPHHDIYSIEDLAQLIFDLKNANKDVRISVKLVSEKGVGTVASGVAKAGANVILISGYDGGTGASPRTSISNAGMPWELGLADAHQTLVMNNLRERVSLECDGKLLTGRDLAIAALLGADEFGFATAPLVAMGCVMMRVCNKDTCPVGIATQNEELRKRFKGKPEYVVNFMYMIANDLREYMAKLGFRTVNEMIGRSDLLKIKDIDIVKERKINIDKLLNNKYVLNKTHVHFEKNKASSLEQTMDERVLLPLCNEAIATQKVTNLDLEIKNVNRSFGTILSSEITKRYGEKGLLPNTITINTYGHAGNSFGAFLNHGIVLNVYGDANDYLGKGLCGGSIAVALAKESKLEASENIIAGNVILYGATEGSVYLDGIVGERFAVRNSGANAVCLGCGDHGCEYMTGGTVLILGQIGRNFAAGMSGGIAYVLDKGLNRKNINQELVNIMELDDKDCDIVKKMMSEHIERTNSRYAKNMLDSFSAKMFFKIMPRDYYRMIKLTQKYLDMGLSISEARLKAFYEKTS